jgi:hypothetical protein
VSIIARWGVEEAQKKFFGRQIEYRKTLNLLVEKKGQEIVSRNSLSFKLRNQVKTPEDLTKLCLSRCIKPVLEKDDPILPQIIGVNKEKNKCVIFFYASIVKELDAKIAGLVDVLMRMLASNGCELAAFVSGGNSPKFGHFAAVAAYNLIERETIKRAFRKHEDGRIDEFNLPVSIYEEIYGKSFDGDIWTEKVAWKETNKKG